MNTDLEINPCVSVPICGFLLSDPFHPRYPRLNLFLRPGSTRPVTTMTLSEFVSVQSSASSAGTRSDKCAFLTTNDPTDRRACYGASGDGDLVSVLTPKRTFSATPRLPFRNRYTQKQSR